MGSQREARATEGDGGIVRAQASARAAPGGAGAIGWDSRDALVGAGGAAVGRLGIRVAWPARASRPACPGRVRVRCVRAGALTRLPGRPACGARFVPFSAHPSVLVAGSIEEHRRRTSLENRQRQQCHHATRTEVLLDGWVVRWVATNLQTCAGFWWRGCVPPFSFITFHHGLKSCSALLHNFLSRDASSIFLGVIESIQNLIK